MIDLEELGGNKLGDTWFYSFGLQNPKDILSNEKMAPGCLGFILDDILPS